MDEEPNKSTILYQKIINELNEQMRKEDERGIQNRFDLFSNKYLPKFTYCQPGEWILNPDYLIAGRIYLLAHSSHAERCIGVLEPTLEADDDDYNKKDSKSASKPKIKIPDYLKYSFRRLQVKDVQVIQKTADGKRKKSNVPPVKTLYYSLKPPTKICTTKKGLWFIWRPSFEKHYYEGDLKTDGQMRNQLIEWYLEYVDGMHKVPSPDFPRVSEHRNLEQFLIGVYPTPEWKEHINNYEKKNCHRNPRDGSQSASSLLADDNSNLPPPPPPPPPPPQTIKDAIRKKKKDLWKKQLQ